ncbi:MerR family transcriptional regulator [Gordonia zhaorongruii]|uniref:MerR family transcriptional regulator n=1 Tax=Gordonia zhaorongruii TaxID=2597659 RepID=UPI0010488448|nr:MerR family transcriptional regulator [Gordonia zhaorongruii]
MRIGEVARRSGVSARMLRHYESLGIAGPSGRTSAGYREYAPADIVRIFQVEALRALGLSLREVGRALDDPEFRPADLVGQLAERSEQRIARERELLSRLDQVIDVGPQDWEQVLGVLALLAGLGSDDENRRQRTALTSEALPEAATVKAVLTEGDPNVAGALRWALARGGGEAAALFASLIDDEDLTVRRRSVLAVAELPGSDAVEVLVGALADRDPVVRGRAALAVARHGDDRAVGTLVQMVVDGVRDVDAADALTEFARRLPGEGIAERLVRELGAASAEGRRRIAQALGEIPGSVAGAALDRLTEDDDDATAVTAEYLTSVRPD